MIFKVPRVRALLALALVGSACILPSVARANDPRNIPLVDQRGTAFDLAHLSGRPTLLTFVATRCTDVCPLANLTFQKLAQRLRSDRVDARLLTVTLDPEYDTPFVMAHMAQAFAAAPRTWTFASGAPADVARLMRSFGVVTAKGKSGVPELHSSFVYVLDRHVRLARTLLLSTGLANEVEPDLKRRAR